MVKATSRIVCLGTMLALSTSAWAQFNGLKSSPRVFNDYSGSTLNITNNNAIPGTVTIDDRNMTNATGTGANRHDVLLSKDGGATAYTFPTSEGFTIQTNLRLTDGSNTPRKEAGLRINSPVTGDVLLIVNSDAGEIVSFGGGAQFHLFGNNGSANGYTPGQTILLGMTYRPGVPTTTAATPASIEYFINRGSGLETTGPLAWSNLEGGPAPSFQVGVYAQGGSNNNANDFVTAQFTGLTASVIPEPAGVAVLALAGAALVRRRAVLRA